MKLYRPVLIESAEQADALPIGTVTLPPARHSGNTVATVKGRDGLWRETGNEQPFTDAEMLDEIALVPIEAEEEWAVSHDRDSPAWSSVTKERAQSPGVDETALVRYVTPWEEA